MTITIPPEALEAARTAWLESASDYKLLDESIRAAALALIGNWPGKYTTDAREAWSAEIILPLTETDNG